MPATGIEPVREYKSRRILSPVRLPVPPRRHFSSYLLSGTNRARTYDPLLVRQMLSQLSYDPNYEIVLSRYLSKQRPRRDSNSRPPPWQGGALTNWATGPLFNSGYTLKTTYKESFFIHCLSPLWLCPRPISNSQLHVLPHFHLCPIYLVVFKGSY